MSTIDTYISLNSPWTYLGSKRLIDLADTFRAKVNVIPVQTGVLFEATGGLALPKRSPQRQAYRMMELRRWRTFLDVPINLEPAHFPADEAAGVRLVLAAKEIGADALRLSSEIGAAVWERDEDIAAQGVLEAACGRAGLDPVALHDAASRIDASALHAEATQHAIDAGVFGVPTYAIDGELFWGQDRLEFVQRKLASMV